jgi:hypothetical protein
VNRFIARSRCRVGWWEFRRGCSRTSTGDAPQAAVARGARPGSCPVCRSRSPRGTYCRPLSSRRTNLFAAFAFRRDWTRTSSKLPCWSTARHRMPDAIDPDVHLVEVPLVARAGAPSTQPVRVLLPEPGAPTPDRFVADHDTAFEHHLLDVAEAEWEPEVQPHAVADDLTRVPVALVRRPRGVTTRILSAARPARQRDSALLVPAAMLPT